VCEAFFRTISAFIFHGWRSKLEKRGSWSNSRASSSIEPRTKAGDQTGGKHHDVSTPPIPPTCCGRRRVLSGTPAADRFNEFMSEEVARWTPLVRKLGIKLDQ
jgi:hypothetical protein